MDVLRTFCGLNEAPSQSCGSLGYPVSAVAAGLALGRLSRVTTLVKTAAGPVRAHRAEPGVREHTLSRLEWPASQWRGER